MGKLWVIVLDDIQLSTGVVHPRCQLTKIHPVLMLSNDKLRVVVVVINSDGILLNTQTVNLKHVYLKVCSCNFSVGLSIDKLPIVN